MARPRKEIDKTQFEQLCAMQCTEEEICAWFDITDKTLTGWCKRTYKMSFSDIFKTKRRKGYISLRRTQFEMAKDNPTMAIFLGKQYLGQSDKKETKLEVESDGFLEAIAAQIPTIYSADDKIIDE